LFFLLHGAKINLCNDGIVLRHHLVIFQPRAERLIFSTLTPPPPPPGKLIFYNDATMAQQSTCVTASTKHSNSDKSTKDQLAA